MIRIGVVYNVVRDLCNKDQKGFVTPAVFNTLAEVAQMNVYKPGDMMKISSMNVFEENTSVEIVYDAEKAKRILNSNLSAPTREFPIALIDGYSIEIFPNEIAEDINIKYYRLPAKPLYVTQNLGEGLIIEDAISSVNFELPPHYFSELVGEIARMIGVRLRDDILMQYGTAEITNK
jgi:hypothetical protein